ncbi:MAG: hypothetical protein AAGI91_00705 [Bacteroidota bacterium]
MPCLRQLRSPVLLLVAALCFTACDEDAPTVTVADVDFNCGRPEVTFAIDRDDEEITNLIVNWGRNHIAMNPPSLYASDPVGPAFGDSEDWSIRDTGGADASLPADEDLDVFLRFGFANALQSMEQLTLNLQVQYRRAGESVQSVFSQRVAIPFDAAADAACNAGGNDDGGGGVGDPPIVDTNPATCPDDAASGGGLAAPVLDPLMLDGPLDGETCAGIVAGNVAIPNFMWRPVEGVAATSKAYQVEIRRAGQPSCLGDWSAETSAHWSGSNESCIVFDFNTDSASQSLLQSGAYEWRVRASCTREDGSLASGPFTPFMAFETAGRPEKLTLRTPADGATISTLSGNTSAVSVAFEWLPAACGPATYRVRVVESFEAPEDSTETFDFPSTATADGPGQLVTVDGEERVRITSLPLEVGRDFVWWVYADTPNGRTPVLGAQDLRTFSIED